MYCPICGAESTQGLNYCKRCGASLGNPSGQATQKERVFAKIGAVFSLMTVGVVSVLGLMGMFITLNENQAIRELPPQFLTAVLIFTAATVFGVVGLLIWFALRLMGVEPRRAATSEYERRGSKVPPQLSSLPQGLNSVTEHTSVTEQTTRGLSRAESDQLTLSGAPQPTARQGES